VTGLRHTNLSLCWTCAATKTAPKIAIRGAGHVQASAPSAKLRPHRRAERVSDVPGIDPTDLEAGANRCAVR
jgi:hypothetical protein